MATLEIISKILLLFALGTAAILDMKTREIPVVLAAGAFAGGLTLQLIIGKLVFYEILLGCLVGLALVGISILSHQDVGLGDGLMFIATGAFLGLTDNLFLLLISLGLSSLAAVALLIILKLKGKARVPFLPFVLCGYICLLAI